jgi:hypothetical protein
MENTVSWYNALRSNSNTLIKAMARRHARGAAREAPSTTEEPEIADRKSNTFASLACIALDETKTLICLLDKCHKSLFFS